MHCPLGARISTLAKARVAVPSRLCASAAAEGLRVPPAREIGTGVVGLVVGMALPAPALVVMEADATLEAVLDAEVLAADALLAADVLAVEAVACAVLRVLVRKRVPDRVRRLELVVPAEEAVTAAAVDSGASGLAAASPDAVALGILVVAALPRTLPASVIDRSAVPVFLVRVPLPLRVAFRDPVAVAEVALAVTVRVFLVQLVLELPSAPGAATGGCAPPPPAAGPPTAEPPSGKERVALAAAANPSRKESVICMPIAD